jgi:type III secretory pathway component EscU
MNTRMKAIKKWSHIWDHTRNPVKDLLELLNSLFKVVVITIVLVNDVQWYNYNHGDAICYLYCPLE